MNNQDPYEHDDYDDPYGDAPEQGPQPDPGQDADAADDFGYELSEPPPASPETPANPGTPGQADPPVQSGGTPSYVSLACVSCGYNLTGVSIGGSCPECGDPVEASLQAGAQRHNGFAITSMVLGITSLVSAPMACCCLPISPILAIVGLIFGILAFNQLKTDPNNTASKNMNLAGLICSGITLALSLVFLIIAVLGNL